MVSKRARLVTGRRVVTGTVVTVATATGTEHRAATLTRRHDPVGEAMEGYAVGVAATAYGVPAAEIRAVSNAVGRRDRSTWDVPAALTGIEQQRECRALARAERPAALELGNLGVCPGVIGPEPIWLQTCKGIVRADVGLNGVSHDLREDGPGEVRHPGPRGADFLDDVPRTRRLLEIAQAKIKRVELHRPQ